MKTCFVDLHRIVPSISFDGRPITLEGPDGPSREGANLATVRKGKNCMLQWHWGRERTRA